MRKCLLLATVMFASLVASAQAPQTFTFNAYGGYTFMDRVRFDASYADVQGGFQWGGGLEYFIQRNQSIELKYENLATKFPLYNKGNGNQINPGIEKGTVQFITLGGKSYFPRSASQKAIPFIGGGLGVGILDGEGGSTTKFGWNAELGVKINTNSVAGLKLRAYIQSITSTFGTDYWVYPGWGTVAVPDYATILQFGLGGVICLDFSKKKK